MRLQKECPICNSTNVDIVLQENIIGNGNNVFQNRLESNNSIKYEALVKHNSAIIKYINRTYNLTIMKCLDCGHLYQYNIFNKKEEYEYHTNFFKKFKTNDWFENYYELINIMVDELKILNSIKKFKSILDVGAGFGEFCFIAKVLKLDPYAFDICEESNKYLKNNSIKSFNDIKTIEKKFEVIRVSHILSHIHNDIKLFISSLIDLLDDDGIICFADHILDDSSDLSIIKSPLLHVNIFSNKSFKKLMNNFSLKEIKIDYNNSFFKCYKKI